MNDGETMRLIVAERQAARIVREVETLDDAIAVVRRAIESDRTLTAMGENRVSDEEALELTGRVMDATGFAMRRELARRRIARTLEQAGPMFLDQAARMDAIDRGEADPDPEADEEFVDEMERELRRRGEL